MSGKRHFSRLSDVEGKVVNEEDEADTSRLHMAGELPLDQPSTSPAFFTSTAPLLL